MQGFMTRAINPLYILLAPPVAALLLVWWLCEFTAPAKIPLSYVIGQVQNLDGTCFVPAREALTFDRRGGREGVPTGTGQDILEQMQAFRNFHEGRPPRVKYDFHFGTECKKFSVRLSRRPVFWYSSETGVFRSTRFERQWCVAPEEFQIRMRALRKEIMEKRRRRLTAESEATAAAVRAARRDERRFQSPLSPVRDHTGLGMPAVKPIKPIQPL